MGFLKLTLFLTILALLTACGGKKGVTKTSLILGGAIDSLAGQAGGTMIYGRQISGGSDNFAIKLPFNDDLELSNGTWSFAAVSWDGDSSNYAMEGTTRCGVSDAELLGGEQSISLSLSSAGCFSQFFGDSSAKEVSGEPKRFIPVSCAYTSKNGRVEDDFCTNSVAQSFVVELPQKLPGANVSSGLISRCLSETNFTSRDMDYSGNLRIPMFFSSLQGQPYIKLTLYEDNACSVDPQVTLISNPLAGEASRPIELNTEDTANELFVENPPCLGTAGNQANPFETETSNYIICESSQIATQVSSTPSASLRLGRDIDFLNQAYTNNVVTTSFNGSLDGAGFSLKNFTINASSTDQVGFFRDLSSVFIKNLKFSNVNIIGTTVDRVGVLAGSAIASSSIENVSLSHINLSISGKYSTGAAGALLGEMLSGTNIRNVSASQVVVDIDGYENFGGLVGNVQSSYLENININEIVVNGTSGNTTNFGGAIGILDAGSNVRNLTIKEFHIGESSSFGTASTVGVGGAIGLARNSLVELVKAQGVINSAGEKVGGVVGILEDNDHTLRVKHLISTTSRVNGQNHVGGVIGSITTSANAGASVVLKNLRMANSGGEVICSNDCGGLIGTIAATTQTNVDVVESWVELQRVNSTSGYWKAGGMAARSNFANWNQVFAKTQVVTNSPDGTSYTGGLFGQMSDGNLTNFYFIGETEGVGGGCGGIAGMAQNSTINYGYTVLSNCFADFPTPSSVTLTNVFSTAATKSLAPVSEGLTPAQIVLAANLSGLNSDSKWNMADNNTYKEMIFYDAYSSFAGLALGTHEDPYLISSINDWNQIGDREEFMGAVFKLTADLDFDGQTFIPIASDTNKFFGVLKGNNKTIKNVNLTGQTGPLGIIRSISNYGLANTPSTGVYDGLIGSNQYNKLFLENITFESSGDVGALVGNVKDNYAAPADVDDHRYAIRIKGVEVINSTLESTGSVGALAGNADLNNGETEIIDVKSFYNSITVNSSGMHAGGVVGKFVSSSGYNPSNEGRVESLRSSGNTVEGASAVVGIGGIFGYFSASHLEVRKLISNNTVSGEQNIGGLVGHLVAGRISEGVSKGSVTGVTGVGGFVGEMSTGTTINGSYSTASVDVSTANAGAGFAGVVTVNSIIQNSWCAASSITGTIYEGTTGSLQAPVADPDPPYDIPPTFVYVGSDDGFTETTHVSEAQLKDEAFYNANFISVDPFMFVPGDFPRPYFEVFHQYFVD